MKETTINSDSRSNFHFQIFILIVGISLLIIKTIAWWITDSVAIFSDALESIVNVIAAIITLYTLYLTSLPRDANHPYGHGKAEFISSAIEGTLISIAALLIGGKAIYNLFEPTEIQHIDTGLALIVLSGLVNFIAGYMSIKKGEKTRSIALIAGGKHLIVDTYSTIGIVGALIAIRLLGWLWIDPLISLVIAFIIGRTGYKIIRKSLAGMMDEADRELLQEIVDHICSNRKTDWIDIHNLRIIKYGSVLHVDCHLTVPYYYDVERGHDLVDELEDSTRTKFGESVELFVHVDPCKAHSCPLCAIEDCPVRQAPFVKRINWNVENISKNKQHTLESTQ